ncbi:HAD family hydrolase [Lysobacter enzymogenes]|uniref:HAD family hydrolase n=1 Tax=Lysobacter enzymogenes TaxID=69 RepID=UPI001AF440FC|nr:HAD family hydrolase [Lysobacter enzymogenes]QQQ00164.1 HAD family hydrolase [Lysobacter enzymogenes]
MAIRAVVFDVFGTLVYMRERRRPFRRLVGLLEARGRHGQAGDAARIMSRDVGLAGAAALLGAELGAQELASLERDLQAELASVRLFDDTAATLQALRARGLRLGLCSNLAAPYAPPVRALLPFELDAYAWSFEVGAVKPDPAIYAHVCERLGCAPAEVLMIGDTRADDWLGPRDFGMHSRWLRREGGDAREETIAGLAQVLAEVERLAD